MLINFNGSCQGTPGPPPTHTSRNAYTYINHICTFAKIFLPLCIITIDLKWITVGAVRFGSISMCIVRCHPINFCSIWLNVWSVVNVHWSATYVHAINTTTFSMMAHPPSRLVISHWTLYSTTKCQFNTINI